MFDFDIIKNNDKYDIIIYKEFIEQCDGYRKLYIIKKPIGTYENFVDAVKSLQNKLENMFKI